MPDVASRLRSGATIPVDAYDRTQTRQAGLGRARDDRQRGRPDHRHLPGRDDAADGGDPAGRHRRLPLPAAVGAAGGRLSDHPGADLLSRRQPGGDDLVGHRAARAAVRPDAGPQPDDLDELGGASVITLQFSLDLSLDVAEQEVQAAINAAGQPAAADLPAPPIYAKVNPADAPILTLALTSKTLPLTEVEDLADTRSRRRSRSCPASAWSASAAASGRRCASRQSARARRLRPQHRRPAHHDRQRQRQHAEGQFRRPDAAPTTINANDQITERRRLRKSSSPTATARRCAVGRRHVVDGAENTKLAAWMNTTPAVILNIQRQPGANVIEVVDRIKALLPQLQAALPPRRRRVLTDRTDDHPRLGRRRRIRAGARRRPGRAGDLRVPAQRAGDDHPEPLGAAVAGRHLRRDVSARASASTTCR
jgi:hypothetical protein